MAMAHSFICFTNFINTIPSKNPTSRTTPFLHFSSNPIKFFNHTNHKRGFRVPSVASTSARVPVNVDYLEAEFSGHGVSFGSIGESCIVRMGMDNGSVATLMLPSGLITSYKALMWHGGLLELLHTSVSEGEDGGAVIQGGVSLAFKCEGDEGLSSWSPTSWALSDVRGNPQDSIQVELISSSSENKVEVKHIVTLHQDLISSEVVIKNLKTSPLRSTGLIIGHLAVSTPEATYAVGLERSNFSVTPPILSNFSIIPPDPKEKESDSGKLWGKTGFMELFSNWGSKATQRENDDGEEDDNYKHLAENMSKIYINSPRNVTVIDRGRRNSVTVGREGFDELYIFSPGSNYKAYSKYSYICVGQAALIEPIIVAPEAEWRGVQHLHNPNL